MRKDTSIFIKLNSIGVIFTIIIIISIIGIGIYALVASKYEYTSYYDNSKANPPSQDPDASMILLFAANYSHLMGILGGGFYLHNISLPIYRNSKHPENNVRDVFLGFVMVCLSYMICGVLGYYGFSSKHLFGDDVQIS